ncbi:hypothetical protein PCANC_12746 [Puccinia coronata f. sp. avenae]|uniref:Uncharacterized protein n=1 Tax=Puccinia coronata f. sp. avenae TaxID=200324 RepID=A0A2N5VJQ7_9BASI|nr:hypothetical protein PCANC_12746 [Puccinia coronata f. sp. avenae]
MFFTLRSILIMVELLHLIPSSISMALVRRQEDMVLGLTHVPTERPRGQLIPGNVGQDRSGHIAAEREIGGPSSREGLTAEEELKNLKVEPYNMGVVDAVNDMVNSPAAQAFMNWRFTMDLIDHVVKGRVWEYLTSPWRHLFY